MARRTARRHRNLPPGVHRGRGGRFVSTRSNAGPRRVRRRRPNIAGVPFSGPFYRPRFAVRGAGKGHRGLKASKRAQSLGLISRRIRANPDSKRRRRRNLPRRGADGHFLSPRRGSRRRIHRNPSHSRRRSLRRRRNPGILDQVKGIFTVDTLQTAGLGVAGFVAVPLLTTALTGVIGKPQWADGWVGVAFTGLSAGLVGGLAKAFLGGSMANKILAGAVVAFGVRAISEVVPSFMGGAAGALSSKSGPGIRLPTGQPASVKVSGLMEQVSVDDLAQHTLGNDISLSPTMGYLMETESVLPSDTDVDALARSSEINQVA